VTSPIQMRKLQGQAALRVVSDSAWWSSVLPTGWSLVGFTYRDSASIRKDGAHSGGCWQVQVTGEFMCAMRGLDWEKAKGSRGY